MTTKAWFIVLIGSLLTAAVQWAECNPRDGPGQGSTWEGSDRTTIDADQILPLAADPDFEQQAYTKASNTNNSDEFGWSVALFGDTLAVGAPGEDSIATGIDGEQDSNTAPDSGAVYVFTRNGTTWTHQAYLKASNTGSGDAFGTSVALFGNTLVVGAAGEDSNARGINGDQANNAALDSGAVYVFTRIGATWTQQAYLKASNTDGGDAFGGAVDIYGDTLIVGAAGEDSNATGINGDQDNFLAIESGAVYAFKRIGATWSQQAYIKASNTDNGDAFGHSVAVFSDTIAVGAIGEDSNATGIDGDQDNFLAVDAGASYVFTRNGTTWTQQAYVKASNTDNGDAFGSSVALFGETLAVGAIGEDSNATGINGDQHNFLALDSGAAYVFARNGTTWNQEAYVKASNTGNGDLFGSSMAMFGDVLLVGAIGEDSNATGINGEQSNDAALDSGALYAFIHDGANWSQQAYVKASNTGNGDLFGFSIGMFGGTLATGAIGEDSDATGIDGDQDNFSALESGAAYLVFDSTGTRDLTINAGMNDAWFNPATTGQGVFVNVFPFLGKVFIAMFTFDTERPPPEVTAHLGEPGHRWVTAFGDFADFEAALEAELTEGGIFDSAEPAVTQTQGYGTITLTFIDCNRLFLTYDFPTRNLRGSMQLTRITADNIVLCEALNSQ